MAGSNAKFVWYELMTTDVAAAETFYKAVVGWTAKDAGMAEHYTLMMVGDAQVAGLMGMPPEMKAAGAPPMWSGYVSVDDVDAMAAHALEAGGKILMPGTDIPNIGRFAVLADPGGAKFMLFKPQPSDAPPAMPAPEATGTVGWHELRAGDLKVALDFYSGLFGWTKGEGMDMGPMGIYQMFQIDGVDAGGMMNRVEGMPPPAWGYYFRVDGINAAAERVKKGGGQVVMGPHEVPGGLWVLIGVDPQGAAFHLVSPST